LVVIAASIESVFYGGRIANGGSEEQEVEK